MIRRNGTPTVTVQVDVARGDVLASGVQEKLEQFVKHMAPRPA